MKFLSKKIELIVVIFLFILLVGYVFYFRCSIKKNKKNVDAIIYEVIESERGSLVKYNFVYKKQSYKGSISIYGNFFINDTCIIAIDSTNPEYNYFVELKNKK